MRKTVAHNLLVYFLSLALLLQGLIPHGFMPDMAAAERGVFKITICTTQTTKEILVDKDLKPVGQKKQKNNQTLQNPICPFAAMQNFALPLPAYSFALPLFIEIVRTSFGTLLLAKQFSENPAWPRGPPAQ